jgi:hypothetical protein
MVPRPDAMIMGIAIMVMAVVMGMTMVVPMRMVVGMLMGVIVKTVPVGVIVRHGASLAPSGRKIAP